MSRSTMLSVGMAMVVVMAITGLAAGMTSGAAVATWGHESGYLDDNEAAAVAALGPYVGAVAGAAGCAAAGPAMAFCAGVGHVVGGAAGL